MRDKVRVYACACGLFLFQRSQEDLLTLLDAHVSIAGLCHDKTKALQYIAGEAALKRKTVPQMCLLYAFNICLIFLFKVNLVHGGHVLDAADLEVVESAAKAYLSRESPLWFGGEHILSKVISNPGHFGNQTTSCYFCILLKNASQLMRPELAT